MISVPHRYIIDEGAYALMIEIIESEFIRLKTELPEQIGTKPNVEKLNEVFRFSLATAW